MHRSFSVALLGVLILLAACAEVQPTVETVPSATPTATAIITPTVIVAESVDSPASTPTELPMDTPNSAPIATSTLQPTATAIPAPTPTASPTPEPTATATTVPTPTATPLPVLGSRENPVPMGDTVEITTGDPSNNWEITVLATTPNAWEEIQAENQFNDPPESGHQFYMARVRVRYLGPDSNSLISDVSFNAVGDRGVAYDTYDPGCGVIPDELDSFTELFTGGQIEGSECWQVASQDVDSLVMFVDFGLFNRVRVWFSLEPSATMATTPAPEPTVTATPTPTLIPSELPALGTRQNPVPMGDTVQITTEDPTNNWEITVMGATPDAWARIQAENQFNDPPESGHQYYMVRVRAKYLGPDSNNLISDASFSAVGDRGVAYDTFDPGCGVIPDELDSFTELFTGGQIEGNECWQIASQDVDSLLMFVDFGIVNRVRVWFSLQASG